EMQQLSGLIRIEVSGDTPWSVGFHLGPGSIPEEATTTLSIAAEDAAAMAGGELDPMTAFMSGKIQVTGDMALMMQMQAIQMKVAQEEQQGREGA
ncbi:MAG: SCP2 sterol-binding domain-containing protein, partial [bacterium]|nr:SCP2 sterol-binding domain-containing protein [bacterium]